MDYPTFDAGYSPEILAQADRLTAAYATKKRAPLVEAPPVAPPNSVFTEIGHGLAKGAMVGMPTMVGQMLKAPGKPGDTLYDTGQSLEDSAKARADEPLYHTDSWLGEGAAGVVPALAATAAVPLVALAGGPAALGVGASALAAAGLFGGSTFTDVYEKARQAGASEADSHDAALKAAAIQGVGQGAAAAVGGRVLSGVAGAVVKDEGVQGVMNSFVAPRFARQVGIGAAENVGIQIPTQAGASAAQAAVEKGVGIDSPDPWEAAKASVLPTLAMTALLTPFGAAGTLLNNRRKQQIARAVADAPPANATPEDRLQIAGTRKRAAEAMAREMRRVDPDKAAEWQAQAELAILNDQPIGMDVNFKASEPGAQGGEQMPEHPSTSGYDVQEVPSEEINIPPVHHPDETIDIHAPPEDQFVHQGGIDVQEVPGENVNVHPPEHYQDQTIDIHAPLSNEPMGVVKRPTAVGNTTVEDAAARIEAARNESAPGQGTALALGLTNGSAIVKATESGTAYSINKQDRVKWLKGELATAPTELVRKLSDMPPEDLARTLQTIWHENKGARGVGPKYNISLEKLYFDLTGKDIRKIEMTPDTATRRDFALTSPNAEELAQAQRDGVPRETSVELTAADKGQITKRQGDLFSEPKPLTKAQVKAQQDVAKLFAKEIENETANSSASEKANGTKSESATNEDGTKTLTADTQVREGQGDANAGRGIGQDASNKNVGDLFNATLAPDSATAAATAAAGQRVKQVTATIATHDAETARMQARLREISAVAKPTREQTALKNRLESEISGRITERERLRQLHGDAMADEIDARDGKARPENTAGYWQFADHPWSGGNTVVGHTKDGAPIRGLVGQDRINLRSYVEAKTVLKTASPEERTLLGDTGNTPRTKAAAQEAQLAMDSLSQAERDAYDARVQHYIKALKLAKNMGAKARDIEKAIARSANMEIGHIDAMEQQIARTEEALSRGLITPEQATARHEALMERARKLQDDMDSLGRGVAGLRDAALAAHMNDSADSHASTAMDFIAKNHSDPTVRAVAKQLRDLNLRTLVQVVEGATFNGARYVPRTDTIEVGRGGMNAVTMVHEMTHAAAHHKLGNALLNEHRDPHGLNIHQRGEIEAMHVVRDVMNKFREKANLDDPAHRVAIESEQEFIAEALANPQIQQVLGGRAGLLTRVYNAIAKMIGLPQAQVPDFQRLLDAAPTLFGDPRRDSLEVFQRAINGVDAEGPFDPTNKPRDAVVMMSKLHESMAAVSAKIARAAGKDPKHDIPAEGLKWVTTNHLHQVLKSVIGHAKREIPQAAHATVDKLDTSISALKNAYDARAAENQQLKNQSQEIQQRVLKAQTEDRPAFDRMAQMGRDGKKSGVYPGAKTLAEAQKFNPKVTPEAFDHAVAKAGRNAYAQLEKSHPEMVKLYNDVLQKHRLDHARHYADKVAQVLQIWGMHTHEKIAGKYGDLDWVAHHDVAPQIQEDRLRSAITHAQGQVDEIHKGLNLVDKKSDAAKDSTQLKETLDGLIGEYKKQRDTPYLHLGRSGDYHVMFEVAQTPGAWDRVGKIVSGDRAAGGLERDWNVEPFGEGTKSRRVYMRFDSEQAHNDAVSKLAALRTEGVFNRAATESQPAESTWTNGRVDEKYSKVDGASAGFIRAIKRKVMDSDRSDDQKMQIMRDITDTWLQQQPETSPLKAQMFADNVAGSSKDFVNTFADRMTMSNAALTSARAAPRIAAALESLSSSMREINKTDGLDKYKLRMARYAEEMKSRAADLQQPVNSPKIDKIRAITAFWRLGLSPAYTAMTMYQPWQVTLPLLGAKHGYVNAARTMSSNFALSLAILKNVMAKGWGQEKGNAFFSKLSNMSDLTVDFQSLKQADGKTPLLKPEQLELLDHLQWTGLLNFGQAQQIARIDPSEHGLIKKLSNISSVMPHYTEVSNRITGALSAYELHLKSNPNDVEGAKKYAIEIVRSADGDHSQANVAPRLGRRGVLGAATPLAVGFQQYNIQMTELLARTAAQAWGNGSKSKEAWQAQKALMGLFGTTALMAGTLGLPFASLAVGVANAIGSILGDANSEPPDAQHAWRGLMDQMFGTKGGEIMSRGLPRMFDVDMSSRSGYQDVAPFSAFLTDRRKWDDRLKDGALDFLGPAVGALAGVATGAEAAYNGDYVKAINDALPTIVRNPLKAYRLSQYGYETQGGNNNVPIPVNNWNVLTQGMGFTSGGKADQSERTFEFNTNTQLLLRRQQNLRNQAYRAIERGDYSDLGKILQQNVDFSVQHPQFHANIAEGLKDRARQRAIGEVSGTGVLTTAHQYPRLQQYFPQGQ